MAIPAVLAVSEIATNRRVAEVGACCITSPPFGTSVAASAELQRFDKTNDVLFVLANERISID